MEEESGETAAEKPKKRPQYVYLFQLNNLSIVSSQIYSLK